MKRNLGILCMNNINLSSARLIDFLETYGLFDFHIVVVNKNNPTKYSR